MGRRISICSQGLSKSCAAFLYFLKQSSFTANNPFVIGFSLLSHILMTTQKDKSSHSDANTFCAESVMTYAAIFKRGQSAGHSAQGGYAKYWRGPSTFVVRIPSNLNLAETAPLICAGATVFYPLEKYRTGIEAKEIGIIGMGGLGYGVYTKLMSLLC